MRVPKFYLLLILLLITIVSLFWYLFTSAKISEEGVELTQKVLEKDIILLTKNHLNNAKVVVVRNGQYKEYIVKENGIVDESSKIIQLVATSKKSPYIEGIEYREAVRVLYYLKQRKPPYPIAGVLTDFSASYEIGYNRVAFISNKDFLEQFNKNKDIIDKEQLIEVILRGDAFINASSFYVNNEV